MAAHAIVFTLLGASGHNARTGPAQPKRMSSTMMVCVHVRCRTIVDDHFTVFTKGCIAKWLQRLR
jgi:hypothetical protein